MLKIIPILVLLTFSFSKDINSNKNENTMSQTSLACPDWGWTYYQIEACSGWQQDCLPTVNDHQSCLIVIYTGSPVIIITPKE